MSDHVAQMAQVQMLLRSDPTNPELLQLQSDLSQLIAMTLGAEHVPPMIEPVLGGDRAEAADNVEGVLSSLTWKEGDRCQAEWEDGKFYVARIDRPVFGTESYEITYLAFGNTATVAESAIKPYRPALADKLDKGVAVNALYNEDGLFYPAVVQGKGIELDTWQIRYTGFKKKVTFEVPSYDIVLRKEEVEVPLTTELEIPDHLKWNAQDSESEKAAKKRRIKGLKQQHKKRKVEDETNTKQKGWLDFQKKGASAGPKKMKLVNTKKSIFASGTGMVGVGSGDTKLTQNPLLKKHVFEYMKDGSAPLTQGDDSD